MATSVWFDDERTRFWRIPDDAQLPAGPLRLSALTGERRLVDPDEARRFEIPREHARQAVVEELLGAARHTRRAVGAIARDLAGEAVAHLPTGVSWAEDLSWAELEARLGPMTSWRTADRAREIVGSGADRIRSTAKQAGETLARTRYIAGSTYRSARAIGKIVVEHPELAETASQLAAAWARARRAGPDDPDRS